LRSLDHAGVSPDGTLRTACSISAIISPAWKVPKRPLWVKFESSLTAPPTFQGLTALQFFLKLLGAGKAASAPPVSRK